MNREVAIQNGLIKPNGLEHHECLRKVGHDSIQSAIVASLNAAPKPGHRWKIYICPHGCGKFHLANERPTPGYFVTLKNENTKLAKRVKQLESELGQCRESKQAILADIRALRVGLTDSLHPFKAWLREIFKKATP